MPNIEVFGFERHITSDQKAGAGRMLEIYKGMEDAPYLSDVVVTLVHSFSLNEKQEPQRFLRIWATSQEEVDDIVKRLEPLDIDIEVAPLLQKFIPKRSSRPAAEPVEVPIDKPGLVERIITDVAEAGAG